jgi:hypothetical protein
MARRWRSRRHTTYSSISTRQPAIGRLTKRGSGVSSADRLARRLPPVHLHPRRQRQVDGGEGALHRLPRHRPGLAHHQPLPRDQGCRHAAHSSQGVVAPQQHMHRVVPQRQGVELRVARHPRQQRHVEPDVHQVGQHPLGVAHRHPHSRPVVPRGEGGDQRHGVERPIRAQAQRAGRHPAGALQQLHRLGLRGEGAVGEGHQLGAQRGQLDRPAGAAEQLHAITLLQRLDLDRQRRLRHADRPRRLGEAALGRHRMEGAQLDVQC